MNLGTAVKILRKEKGVSQKELASSCDISVNALSQIELNSSFPQKNTINKICTALGIPVSYLLFFSINEEDVPAQNRATFNSLKGVVKHLLLEKAE